MEDAGQSRGEGFTSRRRMERQVDRGYKALGLGRPLQCCEEGSRRDVGARAAGGFFRREDHPGKAGAILGTAVVTPGRSPGGRISPQTDELTPGRDERRGGEREQQRQRERLFQPMILWVRAQYSPIGARVARPQPA